MRVSVEANMSKHDKGFLLLQEKWVLFIVDGLMDGPLGFCELSRKAQSVNMSTLSQRLALLEAAGLIQKTVQSTMPPRTSYALTDSGRALSIVIGRITQWSELYLSQLS